MGPEDESRTGFGSLEARGVSRREFLRTCAIAAASVGLPAWTVGEIAEAAAAKGRPPVIWLHFQECTGCSETLLRASHPAVSDLILDLVSLDYHETLFAAAGSQAEKALQDAVRKNNGRYICVIEGAIPTKDNGNYCKVAGRTATDIATEIGLKAGAIIAIGSCAAWGGIPSADPNPTGAIGVPQFLKNASNAPYLKGKPIVSIPGCPPNPYNFLGTVLQYATYGTLPALDSLGRPSFAYARTIHEDCPRRPHFDAGRFAARFGDEGHRHGYCLYKTGCKGPRTHAPCSLQQFNEVVGAWPVGIGHPCFGCTEQALAFRVPLHTTVEVDRPTPPDTYPPIHADHGGVSVAAVGAAGLTVGALIGAGAVAAKKLGASKGKEKGKNDKEAK
ncbi:MAG: hydrogenase small subunit [Actinomycetota bacterium]